MGAAGDGATVVVGAAGVGDTVVVGATVVADAGAGATAGAATTGVGTTGAGAKCLKIIRLFKILIKPRSNVINPFNISLGAMAPNISPISE